MLMHVTSDTSPVIQFTGGIAMPINRLLRGSGLKPEEVERLNRAYIYALASLHLAMIPSST
jgi:hypothetical protein